MSDGSIRDDALRDIAATLSEELALLGRHLHLICDALVSRECDWLSPRAELELRFLLALIGRLEVQIPGELPGERPLDRKSACLLASLWADTFTDGLNPKDWPGLTS